MTNNICKNIKLTKEIIDYVSNFNSDEELLRGGGIPIEVLDMAAFGFNEESIKTLMPSQLKIRWKDDLDNVKYEIRQQKINLKDWAKKINLNEPIDVDYWKNEDEGFEEGFYIQDGHHRYYAAKILNKPLNVNLEIKVNPITKLTPNLGYDDFHRCVFKQVKNQQNESIKKIIRNVLKETIIQEEVFRLEHLPKETSLFIDNKKSNYGYVLTLYNPKTKNAYAIITIHKMVYFGDVYFVTSVAAEKGFGPFIYELAMMHLNTQNLGLMPSRDGDVKEGALKVWKKFYNRSDVSKKTFDLLDSRFRCDIIVGDECEFKDDNDKIEWWEDLNSEEKYVLKVFNTTYSIPPNNQYKELISRAKKWESIGFDKKEAFDSGSELWNSSYLNESIFQYLDKISNKLNESNDFSSVFNWDIARKKIDSAKDKIKNNKQAYEFLSKLLDKTKNIPTIIKTKIIKYATTFLIVFLGVGTINNLVSEKAPEIKNEIELHTKEASKEKKEEKTHINPRKSSNKLIDFLKYEEGSAKQKGEPVLKAYKLGDGMITVGWGHAERISNSKFKEGDVISFSEAEKLLKNDISEAEYYLNNILDKWEDDNIKIEISQGMYDAMVSMIFNMGIGNFRKSDFIQFVKNNNFKKAANEILTTNVSYPGHVIRRQKEKEMFLNDDLNNQIALKENNETLNSCNDFFNFDELSNYVEFDMPLYSMINKRKTAKLKYISPNEYLELTGVDSNNPFDNNMINKDNVDKYINDMKNGDKFPIPFYTKNKNQQEGRHRVIAAMKLGCTKIPVIQFMDIPNSELDKIAIMLKNKSFEDINNIFKRKGFINGISKMGYKDLQNYIEYNLS